MTESVPSKAKDMINRQAPWRAGVAWWVVLIQGVLALALGLYILFRQGVAGIQAIQFLGLYLLIISIIGTIKGVRRRVAPSALPYHMLACGIGLATGVIISIDIWQDFMTPTAALVVVSIGLLLYGLSGLLEWFLGGSAQRTWLSLGLSIVELLLGLAVLWSRLAIVGEALRWTGILATIAGVALLGYAFFLYGRQKQATGNEDVEIKTSTLAAPERDVAAATPPVTAEPLDAPKAERDES